MAEEKQEKKRAGIVWRILKWFGLAVLTVLIILGLIFEAPWKVITLLLIVLAACRILPKPAIKWFWLSAATIVVILIIWVFMRDDDEGWRPYTFDGEIAALEAKYAIPDSENAAIIYNQLLANYNEDTIEPNLPDPNTYYLTLSEPWSSNDYPKAAEWLKDHEDTIEKLIQASAKEKCRFPINADPFSFDQTTERLAPMRRWARLLIRAANNDLGDGRVEQALEKYIAVLHMGNHQRQQPALIDFLVGVALEELSISQFKSFIVTGDAADEHLIVIEKALGAIKYDWSADFPKFIEHDKLFAKNFLGMFYGVNPDGKIRLTRGLTSMIAQLPEDMKDEITLKYWRRKLMKATMVLFWFYMPSTPQKAARIIDAAYEKYYSMAKPGFGWQKEPREFPRTSLFSTRAILNYRRLIEHMADMAELVYYSFHEGYLRNLALLRGSRLLVMIKQYHIENGRWPEGLDDIKSLAPAEVFADPINSDSFVYKLTEENFTLYSKGKNNIDEGGEHETKISDDYRKIETIKDDLMVWPIKSKTSAQQEVKADDEQ